MNRIFAGLAVVLALAGGARADEKATAVVKKGIEAHGGAEALNKYLAGKLNLKGELSVLGMDLQFTGKLIYSGSDRYRMEMETEIMGMKMSIKQTVKGDSVKSSIKVGGMDVPGGDDDKEDLKLAAVMQEAERLTPLLDDKKFTIKHSGEEEVDGKKADIITVTSKSLKKDMKFSFDQKTGLLVKTAHRGKGPGADGQPVEVDEESIHSDFKEIKGIKTAQKMDVKHDGKKFMTIKASDIELMEKIDDKEFTIDD